MSGILGDGTASFTSSRIITSGASGGAIEGSLTLGGKTQPVRLQVTTPGPGRYRGTGTVVQSAFGIKPYVGFFGALKLRDEVGVEFEVDLTRRKPPGNAEQRMRFPVTGKLGGPWPPGTAGRRRRPG